MYESIEHNFGTVDDCIRCIHCEILYSHSADDHPCVDPTPLPPTRGELVRAQLRAELGASIGALIDHDSGEQVYPNTEGPRY